MSTTFADNHCPDCKQRPKPNLDGKLVCACTGRNWIGVHGVEAAPEESALLLAKGFTLARDKDGDVYYLGPGNRIIWIFADGTWTGDRPVSHDPSLAAYLETVSSDLV
jgi:hypothetical protein